MHFQFSVNEFETKHEYKNKRGFVVTSTQNQRIIILLNIIEIFKYINKI